MHKKLFESPRRSTTKAAGGRSPYRREILARNLADARAKRDVVNERFTELMFQNQIAGPTNRRNEEDAQLCKNEKYESLSPLKATELFCRLLHQELAKYEAHPAINPELADNSVRAIRQIWNARQVADSDGHQYEGFLQGLVPFAAGGSGWRVQASDVSRSSVRFAARLFLRDCGE